MHEWQDDALCAEVATDLFFPEGAGVSTEGRGAKSICAACPVIAECLELGMTIPHGIFGGKSPLQRQRMRREAA